jgi:S1-C subfamily serine protease
MSFAVRPYRCLPVQCAVLITVLLFSPDLPELAFGAPTDKSISQVVEEQGKAVLVISNLGLGDSPQAVGSGFVVRPDGVVLTNYHVIENAQAVTVKLPDGREFRAKGLLGNDPELDIAVLKIDATGLPTISLGDSDQVKVGQRVIAIGNPLGMFEYTVSDGIISAIRLDDDPKAKMKKLLQTTAPISQGSSGGPLLDLTGKVIGIAALISMQGQNLNFAIPINVAKPLIKDGPILAFNEVKPSAALPGFSDCPVIGNMKSGIYHVPGGQYYAQMQFSGSAICLKSEDDARKQGYRRSTR